jgi:hypothetical protein
MLNTVLAAMMSEHAGQRIDAAVVVVAGVRVDVVVGEGGSRVADIRALLEALQKMPYGRVGPERRGFIVKGRIGFRGTGQR